MGLGIRESGRKTDRMGKELRPGLTMLATKGLTKWARNMEEGFSSGLTIRPMMENSWRAIFMDTEFISGPMDGDTKENGRTTKWMVEAFLTGPITGGMMENMSMIKRKVTGILPGPMEGSIRADGSTANSTEMECTLPVQEKKGEANGTQERGLNGSKSLSLKNNQ